MEKQAPFKLKSGNKPSPNKIFGKFFKNVGRAVGSTKLGKALGIGKKKSRTPSGSMSSVASIGNQASVTKKPTVRRKINKRVIKRARNAARNAASLARAGQGIKGRPTVRRGVGGKGRGALTGKRK
tara:strand:+ start:600 stop:977 length:378 start_codon:yes stop_codon:yes gene_type:complete